MLNFDLRDTVAGQQIFEEGILVDARIMVIEALTERFVAVPPEIQEAVNSVGKHEMLKELLRHAIRSPYVEDFKEILAKVVSASKAGKRHEMSG